MTHDVPRDTAAWRFQVWASFVLAFGTTLIGIAYLPIDPWMKGYLAMGVLFTTGSAFTLSKTIRDEHEAQRFLSRISEAKAERILREYELNDGRAQASAQGQGAARVAS
ncbi:YiaA/YiaB family inner membrane protein [Sandaracinus amylolyticus]|uniref:YiaAB two helix domain-containing protein n=1 Tax=Sandaracinus amylolyticus TaxID=927083 RepID=A0A0F6SE77_9BACT|nr:YiaA/YiaB family inner membrane protein [Sandaracinus amylolyticus]AKF04714.1 hypothetical protein DB32_001863 [Sandaracinus amylolyticus]